jgi:hypothetical protein
MKRFYPILICLAAIFLTSCASNSAHRVYTKNSAWEARLSRSKPIDNRVRSPFGGNGGFKVKNPTNTSGRTYKPKRRNMVNYTKPRYSKITKRKGRENNKLTVPKNKTKPAAPEKK